MIEFISNNALACGIVGGVVAGILVTLLIWIPRKIKATRDSATIYEFLKKSEQEGKYTFRSTEAISSHTGIPEARIAELCTNHDKIKRNEKEKQSWRLKD